MSDVRAKAALDRLYAELPTIACQRKCESSCGPILMSRIEDERITKKLGYEPVMTLDPTNPRSFRCPMLRDGLCAVYAIRPMLCRLWGIVETLPCPWGCKPEPRYLSHREGLVMLKRAEELGTPEEAAQARLEREHLEAMPEETLRAIADVFVKRPVLE